MTRLNVALVGAGRMAQTHARVLEQLPQLELRAVADAVPDNAARLAKRLGTKTISVADALTRPELDALIITTPTPTHAELIIRAAQAGKHVFVEKPLAATLEDAKRVTEALKASGTACQVGFQRRFDPAYIEAKRAIDANELGKVATFRGVSRDPAPPPLEFLKSSGGLMVDLGVHDLDTMRFLVGEVAEVRAWGSCIRMPELAEYGLFDSAVALVAFENGALGTLELGLHTPYGYEIRAEVLGEKGRLHLEMESLLNLTRYSSAGATRRTAQTFEARFFEAYRAELAAFADCLLSGRPVSPDAEDAAKTLKLALAAQRALEHSKKPEHTLLS